MNLWVWMRERNILKTNSNTFPEAVQYTTNVQNVYNINGQSNLLVASSSIPSYYAQPLNASDQATIISGTFSGTKFEISPNKDLVVKAQTVKTV